MILLDVTTTIKNNKMIPSSSSHSVTTVLSIFQKQYHTIGHRIQSLAYARAKATILIPWKFEKRLWQDHAAMRERRCMSAEILRRTWSKTQERADGIYMMTYYYYNYNYYHYYYYYYDYYNYYYNYYLSFRTEHERLAKEIL